MLRYPICAMVLQDDPEVTVCQAALGLTVYLRDGNVWSRGGAAQLLDAFLARAPIARLERYTTSLLNDWRVVSAAGIKSLRDALASWSWVHDRPRHFFSFQIVDDYGAPAVGFSYQEIDEHRAARAALVELTLPQDYDPMELFQLALEIANLGPFYCGVGGLVARWNEHWKSAAFLQIYKWARRYRGLDVQDPQEMAWHAPRGLPGTSWLTLVGNELTPEVPLDLERLAQHTWRGDVGVIQAAHGKVVRAGPTPVGGDVNALEYPSDYAEVARYLSPWLVADPPQYWGDFWNNEDTLAYIRRLVEPEGWA
ncbi:MAG: DUF3396 domain-containing protein [Deltaproteobacteria bacterium]|nr:DUF3396 domain-containing protein [Deltaproteobacteria bacterium]